MGLPYFHGSFVAPAPLEGTIAVPSGAAAVAWTLPAGEYPVWMDLAGAMETAFMVATGVGFIGQVIGPQGRDGLLFTAGVDWDVTIPEPLQRHFDLPDSKVGGLTLQSLGAPQAGYWPSLPLTGPDVSRTYLRCKTRRSSGLSLVVLYGKELDFAGTMNVLASDLPQLRIFSGLAVAGMQFRLWLDSGNINPWGESNRCGYLDLVSQSDYPGESWVAAPSTVVSTVRLEAVVV